MPPGINDRKTDSTAAAGAVEDGIPRGPCQGVFSMTKTEADALFDTVRQKLSQSSCETFSSAVNDRMSDSSMEPVDNQAPQQPVKEEHAMKLFTSLRKYYPPE